MASGLIGLGYIRQCRPVSYVIKHQEWFVYLMPTLLHFPLDPFSRRTRLALAEYSVPFELVEERPWTPSERLFNLNPAGTVPVFLTV